MPTTLWVSWFSKVKAMTYLARHWTQAWAFLKIRCIPLSKIVQWSLQDMFPRKPGFAAALWGSARELSQVLTDSWLVLQWRWSLTMPISGLACGILKAANSQEGDEYWTTRRDSGGSSPVSPGNLSGWDHSPHWTLAHAGVACLHWVLAGDRGHWVSDFSSSQGLLQILALSWCSVNICRMKVMEEWMDGWMDACMCG